MVLSGPPNAFSGGEQSDFKGLLGDILSLMALRDAQDKPKSTHLADFLLSVHNIFFVFVKEASWQLRRELHKSEDVTHL